MKKALLNFASYLTAFLLILYIFSCMIKPEQLEILSRFTCMEILIAMCLSLGAYIGNGIEYYILYRKLHLSMEKKDIVLLPLAMNLAGTILPFQGAMAYQIYFFKKKYDFAISHSCAITAILYLITMLLSGFTGIVFCIMKQCGIVFLILSSIFFLSPLMLFPAKKIFSSFSFNISFLAKIRSFFLSTINDMILLFQDIRLITVTVLIYVLRLLSMIVMFAWIAKCLNYENIGLTEILLLNLWNMLSLLFKFTPNNLGISQVVSGLLFAMIGLSMEQGVLLSFAATMIFVVMALTAGTVSMLFHFWQFSTKKMK